MALSNKSISTKKKRGVHNKDKKYHIIPLIQKLSSGMVLFNIFFFNLIPVTVSFVGEEAKPYTDVTVNLDAPRLVMAGSPINQITPGESAFQLEVRTNLEIKEKEAALQAEAIKKAREEIIAREYRVYPDPVNFDSIYQGASDVFGVDPKILKAIHIVETGASGSTYRSNPSGATGPMQFLPSTWRSYGVDGDGNGNADISNVSDAIYSAANYLKACGYPNLKKALWGYNPSTRYYNKVIGIATNLGFTQ